MDSTTPTPHTPVVPTIPLDVTEEQNNALIADTQELLKNGVPTKAKESKHGLTEITRWEEVLRASERPGLAKIIQELVTLREQLAEEKPEGHAIAETLATLGAETVKVADEASNAYTPALTQLGKLLIKLGSSLSR
ncbi:hypothetical protein LJY25_13175 [Hymenobacter sp. BT175]|uniref:hypothetical protein n=1 Tax=Hymenobacter translucens TaxID=2886507 RepID=UPI001D0E3775|nr:hypothetical protein [Hymenobacter translucens]MCC2547401.1 hypothetical protein [Hymenobacter translucens]